MLHAQPAVTDLEKTGDTSTRIHFTDSGSAATNYQVQFSTNLAPGGWVIPDATLQDLGSGNWQADVTGLNADKGFIRVKLLGLGDTLSAYFDPAELTTATEGSTAIVTVHFSEPYRGPLEFRWSGTAAIQNPTGTVQVNGSTAQIVVNLLDNATVDELTYLSLTLETSGQTGYILDPGAQSDSVTFAIADNDSRWQGSFQASGSELELQLELINNGGVFSARLLGSDSSILPDNASVGYPASSITATDTAFQASFGGITIPETSDNGIASGATLSLDLVGSSITSDLITGSGTLGILRSQAHLSTTMAGTFTLARRPASQSTAQVTLQP
jgi:hypothetical protein